MSKLVFNRDGGKTDEFGHLLALMRFMQGEVIEGLQVAANGTPNMSVNVPYGVAAIPTGSGATAYRYFVGLDATENVAIPTANGSNPRNDLIVLWVDKSVAANQAITNNSGNMLKISVVSGNPATTPADPNVAAIQAAIGAANPYIILARVVTGAGVTQINNGNITDLRSLTSVGRILTNQIVTAHITDLNITNSKIANATLSRTKFDWSTFVNNIKSAKTTSNVNPNGSASTNLAGNGAQISFTVNGTAYALVTVSVGCTSTTDFEFNPLIYLDGAVHSSSGYSASVNGSGANRAFMRTHTQLVILTNGAHTLSAGLSLNVASSAFIQAGGAQISAIVMGDVTA